jgi:hypothetical protein
LNAERCGTYTTTHSEKIHGECRSFLQSLGYTTTDLSADKFWVEKIP